MRRIRDRGAPNGTSCRPSASCGVLAPSPRTKRPDDSEASVAAAMAMVAALRFHTPMIPVPSRIREVFTAASASSTVVS